MLAAGAGLSWGIARSITTPLDDAVIAARRVADGDLTVPQQVAARDETGRLLTALVDMQQKLAGSAVTQMDHATQQNSALVKQGAAAAASLREQADQLVEAVEVFKLADPAEGWLATFA